MQTRPQNIKPDFVKMFHSQAHINNTFLKQETFSKILPGRSDVVGSKVVGFSSQTQLLKFLIGFRSGLVEKLICLVNSFQHTQFCSDFKPLIQNPLQR